MFGLLLKVSSHPKMSALIMLLDKLRASSKKITSICYKRKEIIVPKTQKTVFTENSNSIFI